MPPVPSLYVVATPIGNLEDITLRALRILREAPLVAAEDTRSTRHLLDKYDIRTPVTSYHEHNKKAKLPYLMEHLRASDLALVSEAGMPGISDPGYELIKAAIEDGINIIPVPGPSAAVTAVAVSGLPADQFSYLGFLPRRPGERRRLLRAVAAETRTLVAYEAPHRVRASLEDILTELGDRPISVARELTKVHEEIFRGPISRAIEHFVEPRGEFTLVVAGRERQDAAGPPEEEVVGRLRQLRRQGAGAREATAALGKETGWPRRKLYSLWLKI